VLKEVALVACEDTRHTAKLLHAYGIATPRESYHEHSEAKQTPRLLAALREGRSLALVSDAGTPLLSDPGYQLVSACRREGIPVVPIPGACAAVAALSASGLPTDSCFFAGYLPPRRGVRRSRLEQLAGASGTLVFYEAPHRIVASLEDMLAVLGPRRACLAREITKLHEEWICGTLAEILETMAVRARVLGEFTILIDRGPARATHSTLPESLQEHFDRLVSVTGIERKDALKQVARQRGISRREAYREMLRVKPRQDS
jgi:16S rRNA (cytidine1402-2'-O)-methyltransferase